MRPLELHHTIKTLLQDAGVDNAGFDADALIEQAAGCPRLLAGEVTDEQAARATDMARRRAARVPLQYLLGRWPFLDIELLVGPGVLIPRGETEELCLAAAALCAGPAPRILDLCAGSGALALGLQSRLPDADVTAVEADGAAYGWLLRNIIHFEEQRPGVRCPAPVRGNALSYCKACGTRVFDLIVCNPPYVTEAEYRHLAPEVLAEPKTALVPPGEGARDGLLFYREIAKGYKAALKPGGALAFEIGAGQGEAVRGILLAQAYTGVEIRQDMAGKDRIALARV